MRQPTTKDEKTKKILHIVMKLHILDHQPTLVNKYLAELRDVEVQKDSMRFRRNLERVGEIMAYEVSKTLHYTPRVVRTPLGDAEVQMIDDKIVLATVFRAGLPLHQGFLNYFDNAENAFVSAYRKYSDEQNFSIEVEYIACGELEGKTLLLVDPMLATGSSFLAAYDALVAHGGRPAHTHLVAVLASRKGVDTILENLTSDDVTLWCATVDEHLNEHKYIVPGLGDAGDLCYGPKL